MTFIITRLDNFWQKKRNCVVEHPVWAPEKSENFIIFKNDPTLPFFVESISTIKVRMFAKKLELQILKFGRVAAIFAKMNIFKTFFKNLISRSFSKKNLFFKFCLL